MKQKKVVIIDTKDKKKNKDNSLIRTKVSTKNYKVNRLKDQKLLIKPIEEKTSQTDQAQEAGRKLTEAFKT